MTTCKGPVEHIGEDVVTVDPCLLIPGGSEKGSSPRPSPAYLTRFKTLQTIVKSVQSSVRLICESNLI